MASYGLSLQTAPTVEPLELSEVKVQCGVAPGVAYHDLALQSWITAARQKVEEDTGRALVNQTWELSLDCWPLGLCPIYLPKPPLSSVTSVKYFDTSNVEQTLATTVYKSVTSRQPGEIHLKQQQSWPSLYGEAAVITIRFVAGYGAAATSVPDGLKAAMKLLVHKWFDPAIGDIDPAYQALINQYLVGDEFHVYAR